MIAEIETDKATMEVEAVDEGVLGKILVQDGTEGVKVNEPIAILVDQGEAVPAAAPRRLRDPRRPRPPRRAPPPEPARSRQREAAAGAAATRGTERQWARCGRRAHLRLAAGAADGEAGRDRSRGAEGQRAERAHRQGGHRGGAAERRARRGTAACRGGAGARSHARRRRSPRRTSWCRTVRSGR